MRDPAEADVHVIVTSSDTGSGGTERTVALIGLGRFKGMEFKTRAISESSDTEDTQRQRLATAITIGLLNFLSIDGVKGGLTVEVEQTAQPGQAGPAVDPWNFWVYSLQGSVSAAGEESTRQLDLSAEFGADRITDDWKITVGFEIEQSREDFDLDEEEPLRAERNERDFDALVARSLNDHWSLGGRTSVDSSSFDNIAFRMFAAPAIESQPVSIFAIHQASAAFRVCHRPVLRAVREETLYFTTSDQMTQQEATVTLDQREPWGSLQAELEFASFIPQPSRYRLQLEGDVNVRIARGLSLSIEGQTAACATRFYLPRPRCHGRGSAAASPPPAQRLRIQPADRAHLHVRVDLQHHRQSEVWTMMELSELESGSRVSNGCQESAVEVQIVDRHDRSRRPSLATVDIDHSMDHDSRTSIFGLDSPTRGLEGSQRLLTWNASCMARAGGTRMFGILGWIVFGLSSGLSQNS